MKFSFLPTILVILVVSFLIGMTGCGPRKGTGELSTGKQQGGAGAVPAGKKVLVELYVMSQCPYGAMAQKNVAELLDEMGAYIDFKQQFIASEKHPGEFTSLHGPAELQGDILELCAEKHYGENNVFMDFVLCMAEGFREIPDNWEDCAGGSGLDIEKIRACFEGEEGKELLMASADAAAGKEITGSPTMLIGEGYKIVGARDPEELKPLVCCSFEEADLPDACEPYAQTCPGKKPLRLIVLSDKRCGECELYVLNALMKLKAMFPKLDVEVVDYSDEKGKALYEQALGGYLPMFIFDKDVANEKEFPQVMDWIVPAGEKLVLKPGTVFHPEKEICANGIDDNGDGKADCDDESCAQALACRKQTPATLDLFVMSKCPFGTDAEKAMDKVLEHFKKALTFKLYFIVEFYDKATFQGLPPAVREGCESMPDGNFYCTLHGKAELEEDLLQVCARKYYAKSFKYMDYIACRNEDLHDPAWEDCAGKSKMDVEKIRACAEGDEGLSLLKADAAISAALGVSASPTFIGSGTKLLDIAGYDAAGIIKEICKLNAGLKACKGIDVKDEPKKGSEEEEEESAKCGD